MNNQNLSIEKAKKCHWTTTDIDLVSSCTDREVDFTMLWFVLLGWITNISACIMCNKYWGHKVKIIHDLSIRSLFFWPCVQFFSIGILSQIISTPIPDIAFESSLVMVVGVIVGLLCVLILPVLSILIYKLEKSGINKWIVSFVILVIDILVIVIFILIPWKMISIIVYNVWIGIRFGQYLILQDQYFNNSLKDLNVVRSDNGLLAKDYSNPRSIFEINYVSGDIQATRIVRDKHGTLSRSNIEVIKMSDCYECSRCGCIRSNKTQNCFSYCC